MVLPCIELLNRKCTKKYTGARIFLVIFHWYKFLIHNWKTTIPIAMYIFFFWVFPSSCPMQMALKLILADCGKQLSSNQYPARLQRDLTLPLVVFRKVKLLNWEWMKIKNLDRENGYAIDSWYTRYGILSIADSLAKCGTAVFAVSVSRSDVSDARTRRVCLSFGAIIYVWFVINKSMTFNFEYS